MNSPNTLIYDCPFCNTRVEVAQELAGKTVNCSNPACGQAFQAMPPKAQPDTEPGLATRSQVDVVDTPAKDERELKVLHPTMVRAHPLQFLFCLALIGGGIALAVAPGGLDRSLIDAQAMRLIGISASLLSVVYLLLWWLTTLATTLTVTTKRAVLRRGLIARHTSEVRHEDVRNLQVQQGVLQRIMDVGGLAISSSGQEGVEIAVRDIPDPDGLAALIRGLQ
jgi:hypothetical protein